MRIFLKKTQNALIYVHLLKSIQDELAIYFF